MAFESFARSTLPGLENPYLMFQIAKQHKAEPELSILLRQVSLERAAPILGEHEIYLNTHPAEIGNPELFESLEELRTNFPTASIVLEVHEAGDVSVLYLEELKHKLTELDMKLAYDDFGRGQSRLNALAEVTPDIVKFDMELVRGLHQASAKRRRFVRAVADRESLEWSDFGRGDRRAIGSGSLSGIGIRIGPRLLLWPAHDSQILA